MRTELGERNIFESGSLGERGAHERYQQRLHHQRVDRYRADQLSPEAQSRTRLISCGSHAHELILMRRAAFSDIADDPEWNAFGFDGVEPRLSIVGSMGVATPIACCHREVEGKKDSIDRE